jgi:hypothetical protein
MNRAAGEARRPTLAHDRPAKPPATAWRHVERGLNHTGPISRRPVLMSWSSGGIAMTTISNTRPSVRRLQTGRQREPTLLTSNEAGVDLFS